MIRQIMRDPMFLARKSEPATKDDIKTAIDLMDTLKAHEHECVGMAANMIGVSKRIIVVNMGMINVPMINPVIVSKSGPYKTEEGCLSLPGIRETTRFENIEIEYLDMKFAKQKKKFSGWTAQIIQHEMDHLEGILI